MRGKGGLFSSIRPSIFFFVFSSLWYCVCDEDGHYELLVCLGA